ncbi:glycosyl transferase, group 1 family protein, partial [gut metagenome]
MVCHHLYLLTAMVREWYPDRKVIAVCHGSDLRQIEKNPLEREYIKQQIPKLDSIIALHKEQRKEIERIFDAEEEKIVVAGVGYNDQIFFQKSNQTHRSSLKKRRVIFAGKISEKKGVLSLLRALSYLSYPEDELEVVFAGGHGPEEEYQRIRKLAEACRYPVKFLGMLSQIELAEEFRKSDVFVLPSFFEGLALVNIEA